MAGGLMYGRIISRVVTGVALLCAIPAVAQQSVPFRPGSGGNYGYQPPAGTPVTLDGQGGRGAIPPIEQQDRSAASVQRSDVGLQPAGLLRQADRALQLGRIGVANELLERAETALLNGAASSPAGTMPSIVAARERVATGDFLGARERISVALTDLSVAPSPPSRR